MPLLLPARPLRGEVGPADLFPALAGATQGVLLMSVTTGTSGIDAQGTVEVYTPPGVTAIDRGYNIANGTYLQVPAGDQVSFGGLGVIQIANGSGNFTATDTVTYRVVTITPP